MRSDEQAESENARKDRGSDHIQRRARRDAYTIAALSILVVLASIQFDAFDRIFEFTERHESWELDEFLSLFVILALGGLVFSARRWSDLNYELARRKSAEERVHMMAMHDPLTGMANRRKLSRELERAVAGHAPFAYLAIDLDHFKPVNDLHGHATGDALLVRVGQLLQEIAGETGLPARLGGDEFGMLIPCDQDELAVQIADRILVALSAPIELSGKICQIGASIGLALAPRDASTPDALMHRADVALYRAKSLGRGRFEAFEPGMDVRLRERARLEQELRDGLRLGQVEPYYQSLIDLETGEIVGLEILARWRHPSRGILAPVDFIPMAEQIGVITDLSAQILRQACNDARNWRPDLSLALNISTVQLRDPWLAERILQILLETGFPPERLEVEITENALLGDLDAVSSTIMSLKNQGVSVVLDDFGTGYSSLKYLRDLPFSKVKIDRSFVQSYDDNEESRLIIAAILGLAHTHNLKVTAEGIESDAKRDHLREKGCDFGQGFFYGEPVDADAVNALVNGAAETDKTASIRESGDTAAALPAARNRGSAS